ncbi:MAG: phosphotransferase family protein [Deltaproteobacteria bacterium]
MLSPADADLVRRDAALPGLALLLDPVAFADAVRPSFPEAGLGELSITYVRYKPGSNCLAAYRIDAGGKPVRLYAKAYGPDAVTKLRKRSESEPADGTTGPGRIFFAEWSAIVHRFPDDVELGVLRELGAPESWRDRLRRMMPANAELWDGVLRTLAYKPERRYVAELSAGGGAKAVLKVYDEEGYRAARLGLKAFAAQGPLRLARRIGKSNRRRIMVFEWLPGRLLIEAISGPRPEPGAAAAAGRALAVLHSQRPEGRLPTITRKEEGERLLELAAGIGFLVPRAAAAAESLARRIARSIAEMPAEGQPLHGDFYADQVLVDGDAAAIIDLDRAARGDAASDLGLFLAHLTRDVLRGRISPEAAQAASDRFLEGYGDTAPLPAPFKLDLYAAAGLFGLSMDPFRLREPDWPERVEAMLSGAAAILDGRRPEHPYLPAHPGPSAAPSGSRS